MRDLVDVISALTKRIADLERRVGLITTPFSSTIGNLFGAGNPGRAARWTGEHTLADVQGTGFVHQDGSNVVARSLTAHDIPDLSVYYLTPDNHLAIGNTSPHHAPVTLASSQSFLTLDGQQLGTAFALVGTQGATYALPQSSAQIPAGSGASGLVAVWSDSGTLASDAQISASNGALTAHKFIATAAYSDTETIADERNIYLDQDEIDWELSGDAFFSDGVWLFSDGDTMRLENTYFTGLTPGRYVFEIIGGFEDWNDGTEYLSVDVAGETTNLPPLSVMYYKTINIPSVPQYPVSISLHGYAAANIVYFSLRRIDDDGNAINGFWRSSTSLYVGDQAPVKERCLAFGFGSGVSGADSVSIGYMANTAPSNNTVAIGSYAMLSAVECHHSNAIGYYALSDASHSQQVNALGAYAMHNVNSCGGSTAIGYYAMQGANYCSNSNALGFYTMQGASSCSYSNALGAYAMHSASSCDYSNALGAYAMYNVNSCGGSTAIGYYAMKGASSCDYSNALGSYAMYGVSSCSYSNALGGRAMQNASSCGYSNALGYYAMYGASSCDYSNALGGRAMQNASSCGYSNALGYYAMYGASSCDYSNALGSYAMHSAKFCSNSSALGYYAMEGASSCSYSNALGSYAMQSVSSCSYSTAIGSYAMQRAYNCYASSALGHYAMRLCSGNHNVAVGYSAMMFSTLTAATQCVAVGSLSGVTDAWTNAIAIGYNVKATKSNQAVLGNSSITETLLRGQVLVNATSGTGQLHVTTGSTSRVVASLRAASSQSADILQAQNSAGTAIASISSGGVVRGAAFAIQDGASGTSGSFTTADGKTVTVNGGIIVSIA